MDILQIEALLPSGFHDAYILALTMDFVRRDIEFSLNVLMGTAETSTNQAYMRCRFALHDCAIVTFEPAIAYREIKRSKGIEIDRVQLTNKDYEDFKKMGYEVPEENFWLAFFVYEWNSRIVINARDAALEFL